MFCNFSDFNHVDHIEADGLMLVKYRQFSFAVYLFAFRSRSCHGTYVRSLLTLLYACLLYGV